MSDNKYSKRISPAKILFRGLGIIFLSIIIMITVGGMILSGMVFSFLERETPDIDPTTMISSLNQTSTIYDSKGDLLEKVETLEYRTVVSLNEIPKHLVDAFISIEDERFFSHPGVDPIGIAASILEQFRSGGAVRGASTITQQLVRNMYLDNERSLQRKLKEAYLSLQVESQLSKEQILEAYLNKIYLGQGAYGVQEASQTYFSKNVDQLTVSESAVFAGIAKSTVSYQPYMRIEPSDFDPDTMHKVGEINVLGKNMYLVFNPESIKRQKTVLSQMKKLGKISEEEYEIALDENIEEALKPGEKIYHSMTSYPVDFIQDQAADLLAKHYNISREDASKKVLNDGLRIYSTIDVELQNKLEDAYENFTNFIVGSPDKIRGPFLVDWKLDKSENIIDSKGDIIYFKANNLIDENHNIILPPSNFEYLDEDLVLRAKPISAKNDSLEITDVYTINSEKNLVTHRIGNILIPSNYYDILEDKSIKISKDFLNMEENSRIFTLNDAGNLVISRDYYDYHDQGIVQPQSATVIMDYHEGEVRALVGGRDIDGNRILNRATSSQRQPGSSIKPISVYYPALAEGMTAGSIADDVPITGEDGKPWPRNAYSGYRGLMTYRMALDISSNAGTVNVLEQLGIDKSLEYLEKMGIVNKDNPEQDSIITAAENPTTNDENPSALALGGMTRGLTPLELTAAYGAIANDGLFIKPRVITRIEDAKGNIILDDTKETNEISDEKTAYIMKDMLRTVLENGYTAKGAKLDGMATAGKTGTTQHEADIWFVGFTPYYVMGTWIGNDSPSLTLKSGSVVAANFWKDLATIAHEGLEPIADFERPNGIVEEYISYKSGKLGTSSVTSAGHGTNEIFVEGTEPTEYDDSYKAYNICTASNRLATQYCPDNLVESRYSFVRPEPYDPSEHGGYRPSDANYVPSSYCNIHTKESYNEWYYGPYGPGFSTNNSTRSGDDD